MHKSVSLHSVKNDSLLIFNVNRLGSHKLYSVALVPARQDQSSRYGSGDFVSLGHAHEWCGQTLLGPLLGHVTHCLVCGKPVASLYLTAPALFTTVLLRYCIYWSCDLVFFCSSSPSLHIVAWGRMMILSR
jgi:hypothetical protein